MSSNDNSQSVLTPDKICEKVRSRYESYLKTSFFFKDPALRASFQAALEQENQLLKKVTPEEQKDFRKGLNARRLAQEYFGNEANHLIPALADRELYSHQEHAIRAMCENNENTVIATGTASGKTECFLYPIFFELYKQHLNGKLSDPGVRALILYPMNALANDQRERIGDICQKLQENNSSFLPTFGQYIGQTPENKNNRYRNGTDQQPHPGELIFRKDMRANPPHILLTNYSMLEYLLIRPNDSPLFDNGKGANWQFIVLDEAHQYRGTKGMEMGMLIRRLKQRLYDGGKKDSFRCIATSATLVSSKNDNNKKIVAGFAQELFEESFSDSGVTFGESIPAKKHPRLHAFLRALEGAFLLHQNNKDIIVLNRKGDNGKAKPLEIALCRECGQHYYVGKENNGKLVEANRDPSQTDFGVDYYLPVTDATDLELCRCCGELLHPLSEPKCSCNREARIFVMILLRFNGHSSKHDTIGRGECYGNTESQKILC